MQKCALAIAVASAVGSCANQRMMFRAQLCSEMLHITTAIVALIFLGVRTVPADEPAENPAVKSSARPAKRQITIPEPPLADSERSAMLQQYRELAATLTEQIKRDPNSIGLYSRRGDCRMFLAQFQQSEDDYEKMIALDPELFNSHWRLGIAYFYTGKFEKSAKQFEAYDRYNNRDRENGIWQYMARARIAGYKDARGTMLKYEVFDREPFPQLYAMFEGKDKTDGDSILEEINKADNIDAGERQRRLFFAQLYVGIYKEMTGNTQAALNLLREAAANKWGQAASGGPTYMWQVARLHYDRLVARIRERNGESEKTAEAEAIDRKTVEAAE